MFNPIPNGSSVDIQGLVCHIPPEGYVFNLVTKQLEYRGVHSRSENVMEQKWERIPLPDWYKDIQKKWKAYDKKRKEDEPEFYDEQLEEYKKQEWDRRLNGYWFMNKGKAVYLTGSHYMFMQWWQIDIGYPKYRIPDLEYFYFQLYCIEDPDCMGMLEITKRRFGKCFAKNTQIRMYDGSVKNVQEITEGELVMGNDSTPRKAYGITTGEETMYRIIPNKGMPFECNKSHILSLIWNGVSTHTRFGWKKGDVVNIPVYEYLYLKEWEKDHLVLYKTGWGRHYSEVKHIISPYILGVYLGDGCKTYGHITTTDKEVLSEVEMFAESMGLVCSQTKGIGRDISYRISQKGYKKNSKGNGSLEKWTINPYRQELRILGVLNNKHIPKPYLIDSEANRYNLLAGLIDTDGHLITVKGRPYGYEITQKVKRVAEDVVELCRSLGFYVSIVPKIATMVREDASIYKCEVYRVSIFGDIEKIPCRIPGKKSDKLKRRSDCTRTGFKVIGIGLGEYYGFAVDGNHLFLLEDGIVVHNTFRGGLFLYEYITRTKMTNGGIQSKTGNDGKKVFGKAVISPFKKLPRFFRPEYDMSLGITPKTEIRFQQTNVRGAKAEDGLDKDELGSMIDWGSADTIHYDGSKIHRYFGDEFCKTTEVNVYDRHEVIRYCLMDDEGKIIGKALYSSTVEKLETDREGIQEAAKLLWNDSDQTKRGENGRTPSGMYRFFMTADRAKNFDDYGCPNVEKTVKEILADRDTVKHNPRSLTKRIKKEARTIEEAFSDDDDGCIFNSIKINAQKAYLKNHPISHWRYLHFYRDLETQKVAWRDIDPDKTELYWKMLSLPKTGQENKFRVENGMKYPSRTDIGVIGVDGYSNTQGGKEYGSKLSGWMFLKFDINDPENTGLFIGHIYGRPNEKEDMYNQILLGAEYMGFSAFFEFVADDYYTYFKNRGRLGYLPKFPKNAIDPVKLKKDIEGKERHRGFPTTPFSLAKQNDSMMTYIEHHCEKIFYEELLDDLPKFRPYKRGPHDRTVSAMITLVSSLEPVIKPPPKKHPLIQVYPNVPQLN